MTLRFGQKIALGVVVLVTATLGVALGITALQFGSAVRARLERDLAGADGTVAEVLRMRLEQLSAQTAMLAEQDLLRGAVASRLPHEQLLLRVRDARRLARSDLLLLVDRSARLLASSGDSERAGDDMAGDAAIATALEGRRYEGVRAADDGIYQVVAAPLRDGSGVIGAVLCGYAVDDALLANLEQMTGSLVALWTSDVAQLSNRARPVFGDIAGRVVLRPGSTVTIEAASGSWLLRSGDLGTSGVSYALARSLDAELAFWRELRRRMLVAGGLVLAVALVGGVLVSRRVTRPLAELSESTSRLAAGDFGTRVEIRSADELGALATSFNTMAAEIQALVDEERELAARDSARNQQLLQLNRALAVEIGDRQQAEAEVRRLNEDLEARVAARTAELEAANAQLEAFSYSVSHDLRGPLARIAGFTELLRSEAAPRLDAASLEALDRIHGSAASMSRMVEKLLEFAHVGRAGLVRSPIDLTAMARAIAEELRLSDRLRGGDFVIAEGLHASGDEALVEVALQNLLSNAWKFTSHCPRPRIEIGSEADADGKRHFYVRDNGAGFESVHAQRLFRVFERLHSARDFEGHGIGLATVKRIIEHHGGRIWASGAPGAGSTFRFTLGEG